ncbi:hypothetical protein CC86DRAFT_410219 [Ophiobolus disseminans]|uniref:Rhodopsin domain-containing protein n=1 Tax=Ophiobolus disseminans TaxID=1469910 RepID=A0A6A6ZPU9_9PLEO|nr:hypothetical protein CC86DRAFT_410219 [Ophiobolus disseminans]
MAEPPRGQVRQSDPTTAHAHLIATGVSTTIVAATAVAMRIFTRLYVTKGGISVDDYMVSLALMFSISMLGATFKHMTVGVGYHFWDVPMADWIFDYQVMTLVQTTLYASSIACSKLSILFLYLRLSPQRWFRRVVWCTVAVVVTYALVYDLISLFGCRPIAATWDLRLAPGATCVNQLTKYMALSILNIIIDVFELILPVPVIAPLQMSTRKKITVCGLFATGAFVCAVAIKRTTLLPPLMVSTDYTWDIVEQYHWCFAEVNAGILCATIPALRPFFSRYLPGLLHSSHDSRDRNQNPSKNSGPYDHFDPKEDLKLRPDIMATDYELHSRDDMSVERASTRKRSQNDDEARLWPGNTNNGQRTEIMQSPRPSGSVERGAKDNGSSIAIYVTSETRIDFGRP